MICTACSWLADLSCLGLQSTLLTGNWLLKSGRCIGLCCRLTALLRPGACMRPEKGPDAKEGQQCIAQGRLWGRGHALLGLAIHLAGVCGDVHVGNACCCRRGLQR